MATEVEQLLIQMDLRLANYERNLRKAQQQTNRGLASIEKRFDDAAGKVGNAFKSALAGIGTYLSVRELRQYADSWNNITNKLKATGTPLSDVAQVQEDIYRVAIRSRTAVDDVAAAYARLQLSSQALGLSQGDLLQLTENVSKALQVGGATAQEASSAVIQFTQALGSGFLQGDELRAIRENAPVLAQAIAEEFGVTVGQLKELGAAGELASDRVAQAVLRATGTIDDAFSQTEPTISQSITNLESSFERLIGKLDDLVGLSEAVSGLLSDITTLLDYGTYLADDSAGSRLDDAGFRDQVNRVIDLSKQLMAAKAAGDESAISRLRSERDAIIEHYNITIEEIKQAYDDMLKGAAAAFGGDGVIPPPDKPGRTVKLPVERAPSRSRTREEPFADSHITDYWDHYNDLLREGQELTESLRTAEEQRAATQAHLKQLLDANAISQETYNTLIERSTEEYERQQAAIQELQDLGERAFDRIGSAITEAFADGSMEAIDFGGIVKAVIAEIIQDLIRLSIVNPLKNALFGQNSATIGDVGGIVGAFLNGLGSSGTTPTYSSMAGRGAAMGGPVSAGRSYTVGETGREAFVPNVGGTIIPAQALARGMSGGGNQIVQITTDPDLRVRTSRSQSGDTETLRVLVDKATAENMRQPGTQTYKAQRQKGLRDPLPRL